MKANDPAAKVCAWLETQGRRAGVVASVLELEHFNGDASLTPLGTFEITSLDEVSLGQFTAQIMLCAAEHAEHLAGPQTYQLALLWPNAAEPAKIDARTTTLVRLEGKGISGALSPTEPATEKGLTSQLMRHLEAQARTAAMREGTVLQHLTRLLERSENRAVQLEERHVKNLELYEQVIAHAHERQLEGLRAERHERRMDHGMQALTQLAPTVTAAVAKKLGAGEVVTANMHTVAIAQFLKSLTRPQFVTIMATLDPVQQAVWMRVYNELALRGEVEAMPEGASGSSGSSGSSSKGETG